LDLSSCCRGDFATMPQWCPGIGRRLAPIRRRHSPDRAGDGRTVDDGIASPSADFSRPQVRQRQRDRPNLAVRRGLVAAADNAFRDRFVIGVIRLSLGRREGEPGSLGRYITAALATVMGCDGRFCRRAHTVRPPPIGRLWRN